MKRVLSLILCVVMVLGVAACFAGCGDKDEAGLAGRYNLESMAMGDQVVSMSDLKAMAGEEADSLEFYLELRGDGTAVMNMAGDTQELLYKDGMMWAEGEEDEKVPFTVKGNVLTMEQDGAKLTFKK